MVELIKNTVFSKRAGFNIFKIVFFLLMVLHLISCTPEKYSIKYDVTKTNTNIPQFSNSKIGILFFEDNRPVIESRGEVGGFSDTQTFGDIFFKKTIPDMLSENIKNHLQSSLSGNFSIFEDRSNDINFEYLNNLKEYKYDYILIGAIDHFTQKTFDEHHTARAGGAALSGCLWPLAPVLFPISVGAGTIQGITETDFNNIFLIKLDGPQILWRGHCKTKTTENIPPLSDSETYLKLYTENLKKTITCICESISLSSEMDFPNKISVEQTKMVIDRIIKNKSLANISY